MKFAVTWAAVPAWLMLATALSACGGSDPRDRPLDDWVLSARERQSIEAGLTAREVELFRSYVWGYLRGNYWDGMLPNHPGITVREMIRASWCDAEAAEHNRAWFAQAAEAAADGDDAALYKDAPSFICPPTPDFRAAET